MERRPQGVVAGGRGPFADGHFVPVPVPAQRVPHAAPLPAIPLPTAEPAPAPRGWRARRAARAEAAATATRAVQIAHAQRRARQVAFASRLVEDDLDR